MSRRSNSVSTQIGGWLPGPHSPPHTIPRMASASARQPPSGEPPGTSVNRCWTASTRHIRHLARRAKGRNGAPASGDYPSRGRYHSSGARECSGARSTPLGWCASRGGKPLNRPCGTSSTGGLPGCERPQRSRTAQIRYSPSEPFVLDGVSFPLPQGRCLAIVGPSGAGKSTKMAGLLSSFMTVILSLNEWVGRVLSILFSNPCSGIDLGFRASIKMKLLIRHPSATSAIPFRHFRHPSAILPPSFRHRV